MLRQIVGRQIVNVVYRPATTHDGMPFAELYRIVFDDGTALLPYIVDSKDGLFIAAVQVREEQQVPLG